MAACRDETGGEVVVLLLLAAVTAEAVVGNMGQHLPPGPECTWWKQRLPIINQVIKSCTACKIVNFSLIQAEHLGLLLLQQGVLFLTNDGYEQIVKVWWDLNLSRLMDDNLQHKRNLSPSHHFRDFTPTSRQYSTKKRLVYTEPATADNQESDDQFKKSRTDKANESTDFENEADVPGTATC